MGTAPSGGEAMMLLCWVSEGNNRIERRLSPQLSLPSLPDIRRS